MFLKYVEIFGFKSFAKRIKISFDNGINGIVGPNGSGKSNISDAISWVFGQQSKKTLRAKNQDEVIFNGTDQVSPLNMAEVTVVFDNSNRIIKSEYDEVSITRRCYRETSSNEYFINGTQVRLRDVKELILDMGMSNDSLAMISQGTINEFIESKPIDRRILFESAAGVSNHRARKTEAQNKLLRVQTNADLIQNSTNEKKRTLVYLKTQYDRAIKYNELFGELEKYEVRHVLKKYLSNKQELSYIDNKNKEIVDKKYLLEGEISVKIANLETIKNTIYKIDQQINSLDIRHNDISSQLSKINSERNEVLKSELNFVDHEVKEKEAKKYQIKIAELEARKLNLNEEIKKIGDDVHIISQVLRQNNDQYEILSQQKTKISRNIMGIESNIATVNMNIDSFKNKNQAVESLLQVKATIPGIYDIVSEVLKIPSEYNQAISVALGGQLNYMIVQNTKVATNAIRFLKSNNLGVVNFLPLSDIVISMAEEEDLIVAETFPGYIGLASRLVSIDSKYGNANLYLLGKTIITDTIENADKIRNNLVNKYKYVSLDGDVIHPTGIVSGGKRMSAPNNSLEYKTKLLQLQTTFDIENEKLRDVDQQIRTLSVQTDEMMNSVNELNRRKMQIEANIMACDNNIFVYREQAEVLLGHKIDENNIQITENQLLKDKSNLDSALLVIQQDKKTLLLDKQSKLEEKNMLESELKGLELRLKEINTNLSEFDNKVNQLHIDNANIIQTIAKDYHSTIENSLMKYENSLSEPDDFTPQEVEDKITSLKIDIQELGSVNLSAIEEYQQFEFEYKRQLDSLNDVMEAKNKLEDAIRQLDKVMLDIFDKNLKEINKYLPETFATMFGSGTAEIFYSDESDKLDCGIEIRVNPPGKNIINLNALSGGEKSLVALSVLFAIIKASKTPLSLLDEVDAPLDITNVERFSDYLHKFTDTTQFIIITHREGTMKKCSKLYGATMESEGTTKIFVAAIEEAKKLVDQNV